MEINIRHAVQDDWPAVHEIFQQDHVLAGTQRLPYSSPHVMRERMTPRATHLLGRGAYDEPRERVEPGTPESVLPFPDALPRNRLGLARWRADPDR